jgi:hypothetical protein
MYIIVIELTNMDPCYYVAKVHVFVKFRFVSSYDKMKVRNYNINNLVNLK